jgi:DNA polymerase III epsilon subunit-like protein
MKLLIFDTETTGLPKDRNPPNHGPNNWPHLVSISWILLDSETNQIIKEQNHIIKPNWEIPIESTKIHGITTEYATSCGIDLYSAINEFMREECHMIVAHNMEFDISVIVNAVLWDLKLQFPPIRPKQICTMKLGRDLCMIPGKYGKYKYPKLKEFYYHVFKKMPDENKLHNSLYDVKILTEIVQTYLPLRQAMGLVARSVPTVSDGVQESRTLHFKFS